MIAGGALDRPHKRGTGTPVQRPPCLGEESGPGAQRRSVESRWGSAEVERWLALGPHALLEERSDGVDGEARAASYVRSDPPGIATTPREGPSVQARPDEHRALREGACLHGRAQVRGWSRSGHGGEPSLPAGSSHARLTGISRCIDVGCRRRDDVGWDPSDGHREARLCESASRVQAANACAGAKNASPKDRSGRRTSAHGTSTSRWQRPTRRGDPPGACEEVQGAARPVDVADRTDTFVQDADELRVERTGPGEGVSVGD